MAADFDTCGNNELMVGKPTTTYSYRWLRSDNPEILPACSTRDGDGQVYTNAKIAEDSSGSDLFTLDFETEGAIPRHKHFF